MRTLSRSRAAFAALLAFVLAVATALVSQPATAPANAAEGPQLSYQITEVLAGNKATVKVTGTGYNPTQGIYVYLCNDTELPTNLFMHAMSCRDGAIRVQAAGSGKTPAFAADGSFTASTTIPLPQDGSKALFTTADHTAMTDRSQDAKAVLAARPYLSVSHSTAAAADKLQTAVQLKDFMTPTGAYAAIVEAGQVSALSQTNMGLAVAFVMPSQFSAGAASATLEIAKDKLDRNKEYELVVWKAHTMPTVDTIYAQQPLTVAAETWDALFGPAAPEPTDPEPTDPEPTDPEPTDPAAPSAVSTASAGKTTEDEPALVIETQLSNITYEKGVYVALAEKGQGANITRENLGLGVEWVMPTRFTAGSATSKLTVPAEKLDRTKEYEVIVWKGHTMPSVDTIYSVQPLSVSEAVWDELFPAEQPTQPSTPTTPTNPTPTTPKPTPAPVQAAGSLIWGVSGHFVAYTTCVNAAAYSLAHCAGGQVATTGVGAGYTFPQASTEGWDKNSQTGTVHYSGIVQFKGYGMTMFQVVNPTIVVHNAQSATLYTGNNTQFGAASYPLDLSRARKTVGAAGEVTWSGVVVLGGMSAGAGRSILFDNLTFTVGGAAHVNYGSTVQGANRGAGATSRTPAAKPTIGGDLKVLTKPEKIVSGGRIEITAGGFQPGESGIIVVLYSEPTVLAENLRADEHGNVHWAGMLPDGVTGKHTISVQGSISVGKEISVLAAEKAVKAEKAEKKVGKSSSSAATAEQAAPAAQKSAGDDTLWWVAAGVLVAAAAAGLILLAAKKRKQAGE